MDASRIKAKEKAEEAEHRNTRLLLLVVIGLFLFCLILGLVISLTEEKSIEAPETSDYAYRNYNKTKAINALTDAGFTDIQIIPLEDLPPGEEEREDLVESVTIGGENRWTSGILFSRKSYKVSTPVKIYYHSMKTNTGQ